MRYGVIRGIVEAGNCVYCGRHIDDDGHIFLCEECRREEEKRECLYEGLKAEDTDTARLERLTTAKELRQKPTDKGGR